MKTVVGDEALSEEEKKYLEFHERSEKLFVQQGKNENRDIFNILELA
jgi:V/A-type H+-transporting ATPase subunit B